MLERIEEKARQLARRAGVSDVPRSAVVAGLVLCAIACGWALWRWWPEGSGAPDGAGQEVVSAAAASAAPSSSAAAPEETPCVVHVVGAVRHPGVYELPVGSRVIDAVDAAGGTLPDAVSSGVNLARVVNDGEQIDVPDEDTVGHSASPAAAQTGGSAGSATTLVDLNSADAAMLDTLPGVGPSTAARIIADRDANGPFTNVDDLARVSGIGPKKLEQLKGLVSAN